MRQHTIVLQISHWRKAKQVKYTTMEDSNKNEDSSSRLSPEELDTARAVFKKFDSDSMSIIPINLFEKVRLAFMESLQEP